jgi:hypothetical protein
MVGIVAGDEIGGLRGSSFFMRGCFGWVYDALKKRVTNKRVINKFMTCFFLLY